MSTARAVQHQFVFPESGNEVSCLDQNGKEVWRFQTDSTPEFIVPNSPSFINSDLGKSQVILDGEFVLVTGVSTAYALDLKTGKKKWAFEFDRQTNVSSLSGVFVSKDKVLLTVNQHGDPLVCLDRATGKKVWSYPEKSSDAKFSFTTMVVRDGKVLVRVTASKPGGYLEENRALDLGSGKQLNWPGDLKKVPTTDPVGGGEKVKVTFGGQGKSAIHIKGESQDKFIGVLKKEKLAVSQKGLDIVYRDVYEFLRPRFDSKTPTYRFEVDEKNKKSFEELLDKKVEITGKIDRVAESSPPQITVNTSSIKLYEEKDAQEK